MTTSFEVPSVLVEYEEAELRLFVIIGEVEVGITSLELVEIVATPEGLNDDVVELKIVTHVGHTAEVEVEVMERVAEL